MALKITQVVYYLSSTRVCTQVLAAALLVTGHWCSLLVISVSEL